MPQVKLLSTWQVTAVNMCCGHTRLVNLEEGAELDKNLITASNNMRNKKIRIEYLLDLATLRLANLLKSLFIRGFFEDLVGNANTGKRC